MTHRLPDYYGSPPDDPPGECDVCHDRGRVKCLDCHEGAVVCTCERGGCCGGDCDGTGMVMCATCDGEGWLTCTDCPRCSVCGALIRDGSHRRCRLAED